MMLRTCNYLAVLILLLTAACTTILAPSALGHNATVWQVELAQSRESEESGKAEEKPSGPLIEEQYQLWNQPSAGDLVRELPKPVHPPLPSGQDHGAIHMKHALRPQLDDGRGVPQRSFQESKWPNAPPHAS